ncbi:tripartite tricarboxylate transporter substrate binding protein [Variovorax sp. Sphag1AA]|uniref:Bug family tripartite tricarboxylate transporter substrate binding protein n=1 Tax=Variovorax sp. Sphag1AA TaxID=2587027 RepID=UPI001608C3AC|nr:tripartite tricarboxylate transporter substrate binding protein [Variovorax sp. Sphag1AA]MBB3176661.1 tripartite-type tricarboxylate transporter receptor subunit TctC [Variovorax sp. Sphag1AA]
MKKRTFLALAALTCCSPFAGAQTYPTKPITLVVPSVAGGAVDVIARSLADEMSKRMGQAIIVDNRPGAAGMLAAQYVARANPDGYSVLVTHSGPILNAPFLFAKVPYDVKRDLSLISQLCTGQLVLAVNTTITPAKTMKEFVAWAERNKGNVSYGSYGIGTAGHLMGSYLSDSRKLDMVHVAYKAEAPMLQDLIGGQVAWGIASTGSLAPHVATGRVRILAVMGDHRMPDYPNVPTMAEAGFPDSEFKTVGWIAMLGPANLPPPVLARLEQEARAAVQTTTMKARFQAFGMEVMGTTSAEFRRDFDATAPISERMIRNSGAKVE